MRNRAWDRVLCALLELLESLDRGVKWAVILQFASGDLVQ